jgi:alanine-glyoxylate transaminase / serine-glyoxylate transaminase / serine-pyruvate transaminase
VNIHDRVLRAMDRPSLNHRDPWYPAFFTGILEDLKVIFATKQGTTFIYPGTGTGGWESALQNTLSPGDKVIFLSSHEMNLGLYTLTQIM